MANKIHDQERAVTYACLRTRMKPEVLARGLEQDAHTVVLRAHGQQRRVGQVGREFEQRDCA